MTVVTSENFKEEIEISSKLCVIDLYADWCGPCRMLAPVLEELEKEYPDVKFCKVNVDHDPSIAEIFKVQSIPHIAFVKDNTYLDMSIGYVPKASLAKIIEANK